MKQTINSFTGQYAFLSNFFRMEIYYIGNNIYKTAEHAYQSEKPVGQKERMKIINAASPGIAKRLGKKCKLRPDWEFIKLERMLHIVRRKFDNALMRDNLLATGDAELIEGNTRGDTFWGVCGGVGENYLGKILMLIRDEEREFLHPAA